MTSHISCDTSIVVRNDVQFIPCHIDYNGRAKVSSYFHEKAETDGVKSASFRGRPLLGSEIKLPEGYCGYVIRKSVGTATESRVHDIEQSFSHITYWNLDRVPTKNDAIISALDWIDVSSAIHENENPEDLKNDESSKNGHSEENAADETPQCKMIAYEDTES